MNISTILASLSCAALLCVADPAFSVPLSRVAAVVNGDMITMRELDQMCRPEFKSQNVDPAKSPAQAKAIREAVLERMIREKILLQAAEKDGIEVKEESVDSAIANLAKQNNLDVPAFMEHLKKQGITEKMIRNQLRSQMAAQRLMGKNVGAKVVVTEEEVNEFYRERMSSAPTGKPRVALLVYPDEKAAQKWSADIASGKVSFVDAAKAVSIGPNKAEGGDLGFIDMADMSPSMASIVSHLNAGEVTPLLSLQDKKAQIAVLERESAGETPEVEKDAKPDAQTAKEIEERLKNPRMQARFEEYVKELRSRALVDIRL